jgi:predicted alpha/beta-hydrolase family hydrolase
LIWSVASTTIWAFAPRLGSVWAELFAPMHARSYAPLLLTVVLVLIKDAGGSMDSAQILLWVVITTAVPRSRLARNAMPHTRRRVAYSILQPGNASKPTP